MARPNRLNYATGEAGKKRFVEALRKWQDKQKALKEKAVAKKPAPKKPVAKKPVAKKPVAKKPATKKPVAKKPVAKKPVAKKPATKKPATKKPATKKPAAKKPVAKKPPVKKPVAKKPAGKVPAKKPLISNKNKLRIKKAATTAKTTATKTAKTVAKKAGEAKKAVTKKVDALKKIKQTKAPRPKTPQQKFVSKAAKNIKKYGGKVKDKLGKDLTGKKGILKIRNIGSGIRGGVAGLATAGLTSAINTRVDRAFAKRKGMTLQEFNAAKKKMKDNRNIVRSAKNIVNKVRGKSGESSTRKNIKKQKKAISAPSSGLKIKKTQYSSNAAKKKQNFGAATGTKKADKRFGTFREGDKENRKLQLERQGGKKETYSRKVSKEAEKTKAKTVKSSGKKMHAIEKRNRERFGDAHVDRLKRQHEAFKKRRKKK